MGGNSASGMTVEAKRALLRKLLRDKQQPTEPVVAPASLAQQRLWFFDRVQGANAAYNLKFAFRFRGTLSLALLERAIDAVVARHESLRTGFRDDEGRLMQVVSPAFCQRLSVLDLRPVASDAREAELARIIEAEAHHLFDLSQTSLLRSLFVREADDCLVYVATIHHIVSDGWSMGIFVRDVLAHYEALLFDRPVDLPPLSLQYRDYSHQQRSPEQAEKMEEDLAYWRGKLEGVPPLLDLPTDRPRPPVLTLHGDKHHFQIEARVHRLARDFSRRHQVTHFMTLLAAYAVFLARYAGQRDVVIGSPHANRYRPEFRQLIGFFISTMVLRVTQHPGISFTELVAQVRQTAREAYAHLALPFERLVSELITERATDRHPLFQSVFVLQNAAQEHFELPGVSIERLRMESETAKFDLQLSLTPEPDDSLRGFLEFNGDLFDADTVACMARHFKHLLPQLLDRPDRDVAEHPLITASERIWLIEEWNGTARPFPRERALHHGFADQAAAHGERTALLDGRDAWSYTDLKRRADQYAAALQRRGVRHGDLVALYCDRQWSMIPALLAILDLGAAYVPIETRLPEGRVTRLLTLTRPSCVISDRHYCTFLDERCEEAHLAPANLWLDEPLDETDYTPADVSGCDRAYIIFTSGSTGDPKGVVVAHDSAANLIEWVNSSYAVSPADRLLFITSLSFDLSVYDVFGILGAGASIRLAASEETGDPDALLAILDREPITFWDSAPAALQQLAPFFDPGAAGRFDLRLVFLSGDWVPLTLPDAVRASFPEAQVIALGGATEATIWSNFFHTDPIDPSWRSVPYGNPIQNASYFCLNERLEPQPERVPGDLFIGGEAPVRGYLDPALTAWKFIPDPFSPVPGGRLYRTGDRVRLRPEGWLEFLGRVDHQVKVRGFRVECGEIESALVKLPGIATAVVRPFAIGPFEKRLAAYLVTGGASPEVTALRDALGELLPEYMIPSVFLFLDALPVTANGKLDLKALPDPAASAEESVGRPPQGALEEALAEIWCAVLQRERVSAVDNFFELGGDSILGIQIVARAREAGFDLQPRDLFQHQSIAELAALLAARAPMEATHGQAPASGEIPPAPIQLWLAEQHQSHWQHFNQHLLLEFPAQTPSLPLEQALRLLSEHHDMLRLIASPDADTGWQLSYGQQQYELLVFDLRALAEDEALAHAVQLAGSLQASLDPEQGRSMLLCRLMLPGSADRLLWLCHHLLVDGVSWRILGEDFERAFTAYLAGHAPALPARSSSYVAWSKALREVSGESQLAWWLRQLADGGPVPDREVAPRLPLAEARTVSFDLEPSTTRALRQTLDGNAFEAALITAVCRSFARLSGDVFVGLWLERHGRDVTLEGIDISRTVGWFTALFPLRLQVAQGDVHEALTLTREQLRAIPEGGLGYGLLRYLNDETRDLLAHQPQPRILFNFLGDLDRGTASDAFERLEGEAGASRSPHHLLDMHFEINCRLVDGRLCADWSFHPARYDEATVSTLLHYFSESLHQLARPLPEPAPTEELVETGLEEGELDDFLAAWGDH